MGCGNAPAAPLASLPHAFVVLGADSHELPAGTYCWRSGELGMCADMSSPEELLKARHVAPFPVPRGVIPRLRYSRSPDTSRVIELRGLGAGIDIEPNYWPEVSGGLHTYTVSVRWPEGNVTYVFQLDGQP